MTINITQARNKLLAMPKELAQGGPHVAEVTHRGKAVLAILPYELYESIMETMEILSDPGLMSQLRRSVDELRRGKTIPWDQAKRNVGL
ncbi:MAG: type II toxin-antitoxin system Phd/YefM family antitoxin [Elusimicrobia bacterium]|nr:type II toxin-antitoxin system Phd/YefM family antitoxin [Elusimicrobiota bacterium]